MSTDFTFHFDASIEKLIDKLLQSGIVPPTILEPIILGYATISSDKKITNDENSNDIKDGETLLSFLLQEQEEILSTKLFITTEQGKIHFMQIAWNYLLMKEYKAGAIVNNAILALNPKHAESYLYEARLVWLQEGIPAYLKKEKYYLQKTKHHPFSLSRVYNLSGCVMDALERYDEALMYFRQANAILPTEVIYVANAAEMHYKLRETDLAVKCAIMARDGGSAEPIIFEIIANGGYMPD